MSSAAGACDATTRGGWFSWPAELQITRAKRLLEFTLQRASQHCCKLTLALQNTAEPKFPVAINRNVAQLRRRDTFKALVGVHASACLRLKSPITLTGPVRPGRWPPLNPGGNLRYCEPVPYCTCPVVVTRTKTDKMWVKKETHWWAPLKPGGNLHGEFSRAARFRG